MSNYKRYLIMGATGLFLPGGLLILLGYGIKSYLDRRNRNVPN